MFRYYVSFSYQTPSGLGIASLDVTTPSRIGGIGDLAPVTEQITAQGYPNVKILAFSLYAQERPTPNTRPNRSGNHR